MENTPAAASLPLLGDLINDAASTVSSRAKVFMGIWASTALPGFILMVLAAAATGLSDRDSLRAALDAGRFGPVGGFLAVAIIAKLLNLLAFAASIVVCAQTRAAQESRIGAALERGLERFPALIWTSIVAFVRIALPFLATIICGIIIAFYRMPAPASVGGIALAAFLLVGAAMSFILSLRYFFASYATMIEGIKGGAAIRRSVAAIVPRMGKFVGNMLVFLLLSVAAYLIVAGIGDALGSLVGKLGAAAIMIVEVLVDAAKFLISAWSRAAATFLFLGLAAAIAPKPGAPPAPPA